MISGQNSSNANVDTNSSDSEEEQSETREIPTVGFTMLIMFKEFGVLALFLMAYAALTNETAKVANTPEAYPFFSRKSPVKDWYKGEIGKAIDEARASDVAFIMFYAPWSADSQYARQEFEKTANYMQHYISFSAVNCWQPNSECKTQYSKVYKWPVFIAYPSHGRGVQYMGPISAPHMIQFLENVCKPYIRIPPGEIRTQDVYITAFMNTLPGSLEFSIFYLTALKFLEKDPIKTINFYLVAGNYEDPVLRLHLWNETLIYPMSEDFSTEEITKWILDNVRQVSYWVSPSGSKSLLLSNTVSRNPTLVMFTPRNPLLPDMDYFNMLNKIAREYYDCGLSYTYAQTKNIELQRLRNQRHYIHLRDLCARNSPITVDIWTNASCKHDVNLCKNDFNVANIDNFEIYETSLLTGKNDPRSPDNLRLWYKQEVCRKFKLANRYYPEIFEPMETERKFNVQGLACLKNRSLSFMVVDSLLHYQFAEQLGIDLTKEKFQTAVAIIHDKMESHYTMVEDVNTQNIKKFIINYTRDTLHRVFKSITTVKSKNVHTFVSNVGKSNKTYVFVKEINSKTFLPTISEENKAVLVFYYSKQCSFCSGIASEYLMAAKKLSYVENIVFARIDGDVNILPWEYTMDSFPTIIYFPPNKKSESRVFPRNIPITVLNLLGFILANLNSTMNFQAMWSICNNIQKTEEKTDCLTSLRLETLSLIEKTLKEWRKSNKRQKQASLHKLKVLKHLHLLLAQYPIKTNQIQFYFNKLNSKPNFSKEYHVDSKNLAKTRDEL